MARALPLGLSATLLALFASGLGCTNESDRILAEANAEREAHRARAQTRYEQVSVRLVKDVEELARVLDAVPYEEGKDLSADPGIAKAAAIVDGLGEAVEAKCISADLVALDDPEKNDPMSIGINIPSSGRLGIRECERSVGRFCYEEAYTAGNTKVQSCDVELDGSGVKNPGYEIELVRDLDNAALRLRIVL